MDVEVLGWWFVMVASPPFLWFGYRMLLTGWIGFNVSDGLIVVHGFKAHRIPYSEVKSVTIRSKDMLANGMVVIEAVAGRKVPINGAVGRRARGLADALKAKLAIEAPRHQS